MMRKIVISLLCLCITTVAFGIDVNTDGWFREVRYRYESQLLWFGFNYSFGQSTLEGKKKFKRVSPNERSF